MDGEISNVEHGVVQPSEGELGRVLGRCRGAHGERGRGVGSSREFADPIGSHSAIDGGSGASSIAARTRGSSASTTSLARVGKEIEAANSL